MRLLNDVPLDEATALQIGGLRAYVCTPEGLPFEDGDTQRIGWLFLVVRPKFDRTEIKVYGTRLRHVGGGELMEVQPPATWTGTGWISSKDGQLQFVYRSDDSGPRGMTDDEFNIRNPGEVWDGKFTHIESHGTVVKGVVDLIPLCPGGQLPEILHGTDLRLLECLPRQAVADWAEVIFASKSLEELNPDGGGTDALIDVISGQVRVVTDSTLEATSDQMHAELPNSVLYRKPLDSRSTSILL